MPVVRAVNSTGAPMIKIFTAVVFLTLTSAISYSAFSDSKTATTSSDYVKPSDTEIRQRLTSLQYSMTQNEDTEPPERAQLKYSLTSFLLPSTNTYCINFYVLEKFDTKKSKIGYLRILDKYSE